MKALALLVSVPFLFSCGNKEANKPVTDIVSEPFEWTNPNHELCEPTLASDITSLPFDIAINTNRSDLIRFDALNTRRGFLVTKDAQVSDVTSELIDPDKLGQTSAFIYGFDKNGSVLAATFYAQAERALGLLSKGLDESNYSPEYYRGDVFKGNVNLTNMDSFSHHNSGPMVVPGLDGKIVYSALIEGLGRLIVMNEDGSDKKEFLSTKGFAYGFSFSPDGTKYAFHAISGGYYKVFIGDMATRIEKRVETPCNFNFAPVWSPDSQRIAFNCNSDLWTSDRNGVAQFLGSRHGYGSGVPFTDLPDPHGGGSDNYAWMGDSSGVVHGAYVGQATELVVSNVNGTAQTQLTSSPQGSRNVYPTVSPDGKWVMYGSKRGSKKQDVYMMNVNTKEETQVTDMKDNCHTWTSQWGN